MSKSTMRAITVSSWGKPPSLTTLPKPESPASGSGSTQVKILASSLPQLVRSQISGIHYSVQAVPPPYIPGIEATGFTPDNKLVFANLMANKPQGGGFAEYVNANGRALTPIPVPKGASDADVRKIGIKVSALLNPAMSSWMALKYRARIDEFKADDRTFTVLIVGATSTSGRIAALFARHLGAKSVIGVARNAEQLDNMKSSGTIDEAIVLDSDVSKTDFSLFTKGFETYPLIVLDYVYGPTASALFNALPRSAMQSENLEVRYVHIGTLSRDATLPIDGPLLRSKNVTISGAGPGSWSMKALAKATPGIIDAIVNVIPARGWEEEYGVVQRSLEQIDEAMADTKGRTTFVL